MEDPEKLTHDNMVRKIHDELKGTFDAVRIVMDTALTFVERPTG